MARAHRGRLLRQDDAGRHARRPWLRGPGRERPVLLQPRPGGRPALAELRADDHALQRSIAALQIRWEQGLDARTTTFLDRALPDSVTFYRLVGMDPDEILGSCFQQRYASVFLLDRLPAHRDRTLGPEDEASSAFLDEWLERDYRALGYSVVRVPPLAPAARMDFILDRIPPDT